MKLRRPIAAVAGLAAAATLLAGCFPFWLLPDGGGGGEETVDSSTGEEVPPELEQYYHQTLTWSDWGSYQQTTVTVPLDWDDPTGATIELAVARHEARDPKGSLLMNPGGPGGSGFDFVAYSAEYVVTSDVLDAYDLIGFDPRGVGQSTPIECYTDPRQQDALLYDTYDAPYGSQGWIDELTTRSLDWIAACEQNTGELLGNLDAASVARDMDVLRAVLGDESLNYLGYSYGTYLGAVYAELFPEKVGRMVLDGAVDPLVGDLDALATQMAGFESAYRAFLEYCLGLSACPFSGTVEQAMVQTGELFDSIDRAGMTSDDGRVLDQATAGTGLAQNLYAEWLWSRLVQMLAGIAEGDASIAFESADDYNGRYPGPSYDGNGYEIYTAVTCDEGTLGTDGVSPLEGLAVIDETAPGIGRYISLDDYAVLDVVCSNWPYERAELPESFAAEGAPPILVVGTTNDPATPYAQAVSLAAQLSSGVLISYEGEGHTIYAQGVACVDDAVDAYLLRDVVPSADPMC